MQNNGSTVWVCLVCGYEHTGDTPPDVCPVCGADANQFEKKKDPEPAAADENAEKREGEYLGGWARGNDEFESKYARIVALAKGQHSEIAPMRTLKTFPDWETILFRGAQLHRMPFNEQNPIPTPIVQSTQININQ